MKDSECVEFLQWALPHLRMRWPGFRKVRNQVCKRLQQRITQLGLNNLQEYHDYIVNHQHEWSELDQLCQITISRFFRDKMVFTFVEEHVFPRLLDTIKQHQETEFRIWCAGSGSGEEPYTLALLWDLKFKPRYPDINLTIIATDINPKLIIRAKLACYPYSSIKNLPSTWQESAFDRYDDNYCLQEKYKRNVEFRCQDLRQKTPMDQDSRAFHLICCRNLALTYYETSLQQAILQKLRANIVDNGILMIGVHENIPPVISGFSPWSERLGIYRGTVLA